MERHKVSWVFTVSIHAPRVGSDGTHFQDGHTSEPFQSTLPAWGATTAHAPSPGQSWSFNPRSPRGERPMRKSCRPVIL